MRTNTSQTFVRQRATFHVENPHEARPKPLLEGPVSESETSLETQALEILQLTKFHSFSIRESLTISEAESYESPETIEYHIKTLRIHTAFQHYTAQIFEARKAVQIFRVDTALPQIQMLQSLNPSQTGERIAA